MHSRTNSSGNKSKDRHHHGEAVRGEDRTNVPIVKFHFCLRKLFSCTRSSCKLRQPSGIQATNAFRVLRTKPSLILKALEIGRGDFSFVDSFTTVARGI